MQNTDQQNFLHNITIGYMAVNSSDCCYLRKDLYLLLLSI
jgi:hypothetical protein